MNKVVLVIFFYLQLGLRYNLVLDLLVHLIKVRLGLERLQKMVNDLIVIIFLKKLNEVVILLLIQLGLRLHFLFVIQFLQLGIEVVHHF